MDPIKNPFSPGAGTPPPELVGRDGILKSASILFGRTLLGRSEKSFLMVGLRGVGKTVLLTELGKLAESQGYFLLTAEAYDDSKGRRRGVEKKDTLFITLLAPKLRRLLYELSHRNAAIETLKKLKSGVIGFLKGIQLTVLDVDIKIFQDEDDKGGIADSGNLESDLSDLFELIGEAAKSCNSGIAILIDEIQYLSDKELGALIMSMHKMQQKQYPVVLIGAGLPVLLALAGEAKSYAERLFEYPSLGPLTKPDAEKALRDPVEENGAKFEEDAIEEIYSLTQGYPYFIQEWGYQAWNYAIGNTITLNDVKAATTAAINRLDNNFFKVRFDRLSPGEKKFIRGMAELGKGPYRIGDIADVLGIKSTSLGPVRAKLISTGMIYSPAHGDLDFTVPLFDEFMRRMIPVWTKQIDIVGVS